MENIAQNKAENSSPAIQLIIRAAIVAMIIGSTLTLINQFDALFGSAQLQILPMVLVYLTPFLVVGLSQVFGMREASKVLRQNTASTQSLFATMMSHNIPLRAVILGLAAGTINTLIMEIANLASGGGLDQLPIAVILQALSLPIFFGTFSQALSFRRTIDRASQKPDLNPLAMNRNKENYQ